MNNTGGRVRQVSQRVLPLLKKCWWLVFVVLIIIGVNFSHKFLAVATDSMDPVIVRGDLVLIHNIAPGDVKVGDVIVYHVRPVLQDKYGYPSSICHRVISVSKTV
ncbi:MAG TPA: S26 family signal peptidase, partial [Dehalococcoidales bacterium]|nr:S26 family signal peptidase [Dehalococcoidales bacterium]